MRHKLQKVPDSVDEIVTMFLLFPKTIGGELRWLEKATWRRTGNYNYIDGNFYYQDQEWVDNEKEN